MPLDPNIVLQAHGPTLPGADPIGQATALAQLAGLIQQQQVGRLAVQQSVEQDRARRQLRDLYAQGLDFTSAEGQADAIQRIGAINPELSLKVGESLRKQRLEAVQTLKEHALTEKAQAETVQVTAQTHQALFDFGKKKLEIATTLLAGATPETWPQQRAALVGIGIPETQLPAQYDASMIQAAKQRALTEKDRLELAEKQAQRTLDERRVKLAEAGLPLDERRVKVEEQRAQQEQRRQEAAVDYGLGTERNAAVYLLYGHQLAPGARPTPEMVQGAEAYVQAQHVERAKQQGVAAAEVQTGAKPLEGQSATAVGDLDAALRLTGNMRRLYKPEYAGPIKDALADLKERTTGDLPTQQIDFRRTTNDMADTLQRARSGGQITDAEYTRLLRLVPTTNLPPNVYMARLDSLERALKEVREAKLHIATTPRGQLDTPARSGTPAPPKKTPGMVIDQGSIDLTFESIKNQYPDGSKMRTKEQIKQELRAKGYEVP